MSNETLGYIIKTEYHSTPFVDCPQPSTQAAVNPSPCKHDTYNFRKNGLKKEEKKGSAMYDLDFCEEDTMDMTKLTHLSARMSNTFHAKRDELRKTYGLVDDDTPATAKELIARITAGKYVVPEDRLNAVVYEPTRHFTWRDPSVKKDEEGFKVAIEKLQKARTAAEDIIVVMSDETTRLKALQDFESTTIN